MTVHNVLFFFLIHNIVGSLLLHLGWFPPLSTCITLYFFTQLVFFNESGHLDVWYLYLVVSANQWNLVITSCNGSNLSSAPFYDVLTGPLFPIPSLVEVYPFLLVGPFVHSVFFGCSLWPLTPHSFYYFFLVRLFTSWLSVCTHLHSHRRFFPFALNSWTISSLLVVSSCICLRL